MGQEGNLPLKSAHLWPNSSLRLPSSCYSEVKQLLSELQLQYLTYSSFSSLLAESEVFISKRWGKEGHELFRKRQHLTGKAGIEMVTLGQGLRLFSLRAALFQGLAPVCQEFLCPCPYHFYFIFFSRVFLKFIVLSPVLLQVLGNKQE